MAASESVGDYESLFSYTGAGRVSRAYVGEASAPLVIGRDVSYEYGDHQLQDAHAVQRLRNTDGSVFANYSYDISGNVVSRQEVKEDTDWEITYGGDEHQREVNRSGKGREMYYCYENGQRFLSVELSGGGEVIRSRAWFGSSEFWSHGDGSSGTCQRL